MSHFDDENDDLSRRDFLSLGLTSGATGVFISMLPTTAEAAEKNPHTANWKNLKVWITGGTSGLGKVLVTLLAQRGAQVAFCGIRQDAGDAVIKELKSYSGKLKFFLADITKEEEVKSFVRGAVEWMGKIDLAVNNAGIDHVSENFATESLDMSLKVIQVNLIGTMICLRYLGEQMKKQGSGSIINIASVAGVRGSASGIAYSASKHGVVGLTKSAAKNFASFQVRVNAISPYIMDNIIGHGRVDHKHAEVKYSLEKMSLKRVITVENVAESVLWLGSDAAWNITGQNLIIDGGLLS